MCGIFAYVGSKNAMAEVVVGLTKLEYRGYDSWGVAVVDEGKIRVDKRVGKIGEASVRLVSGTVAIGHTRWATHGGVTRMNAHPHSDCEGKLAVVHNGVIENYWEVKESLGKRHKLVSDTDTELMAHLVEEELSRIELENSARERREGRDVSEGENDGLIEAVRKAFMKLKGLSAFVVMETEGRELVAVKNGSPLVVGLGEGENYLASDANSLVGKVKRVVYVADGQMVRVSKDGVVVSEVASGKKVKMREEKIEKKVEAVSKGRFAHFMMKEIYEQPEVVERIGDNGGQIKKLVAGMERAKRVYLVGCGTAYYATLATSYMLSQVAGFEVEAVMGSEVGFKERLINKEDLVVFWSQSGETIDVVAPMKRLMKRGVTTAAVVNAEGSTLERLVDIKVPLSAGAEIGVCSTKAFTAMVAVGGLVSYELAGKRRQGKKKLGRAVKGLRQILTDEYQQKYVEPVVAYLATQRSVYGIGRGMSYPMVMEAALKIKEVSYVHMEGFAGGELKHGVIALIDKGTACVVLAPRDEVRDLVLSGAMEVKSRGGYVIGIGSENSPVFDLFVPVEDAGVFSGIGSIVVAQLLAYKMALAKGYDPDKPRNLAKSVTVV